METSFYITMPYLMQLTERYNPKFIILDISPSELKFAANEYERLAVLLPYYQKHQEIRKTICLRDRLKSSNIFPPSTLIIH